MLLCWKCAVTDIFLRAWPNFLWCIYVKWNPVEYSTVGVFNSLMLVVTKGHTYILKQNLEVLVEGLFNMYDKKRERDWTYKSINLFGEINWFSFWNGVLHTQQLTRKFKQHNLSLGRLVWWVKALHSELKDFISNPLGAWLGFESQLHSEVPNYLWVKKVWNTVIVLVRLPPHKWVKVSYGVAK